jgi:O-antigen/teichoic acid export membrane protein
MDRYAVALFLNKAVAVVTVLLLPAPYGEKAVLIIACYAASSLVVCVWAVTALGSRVLLPVRTARETVVSLWQFSAPLIVATWVGLLSTQWIQYVIIKQYLPLTEIGLYSLANQVAGVVQQVTIVSSTLLLPHFSMLVVNRRNDEIRTMIEKLAPYGFLGFALLLSAGVLLAGIGVPLIFGPAFAGAVPPLNILLIATMALALFNTFMPLITAHGDTWSLSRVTMVSALVNLGAALVLVPLLGINGAAVATLLGHGTAAAMILRRVQSRFDLPVLRLATMGLPVFVMAAGAGALEGGPFYLAGVAVMVLSSIALGRAFKLFDQEALGQLMRADMPMFIKSGLKVLSEKAG